MILKKVLNKRKGPAVWGPRAQIDRKLYKKAVQSELLGTPNLEIYCTSVEDLLWMNLNDDNGEGLNKSKATKKCCGVLLEDGRKIKSKSVVITTVSKIHYSCIVIQSKYFKYLSKNYQN